MLTYKKEFSTLVEDVMTHCDIYSAEDHKFHTERAIWDTGADTTIISSRIVKELNLLPYKLGGISGIGGATGSIVYLVPTGDNDTTVATRWITTTKRSLTARGHLLNSRGFAEPTDTLKGQTETTLKGAPNDMNGAPIQGAYIVCARLP